MRYLPPFDVIKRSLEISTLDSETRVNIPYEQFLQILKLMLAGVEVNEAWYTDTYQDIGQAVTEGALKSAQQHFMDDGYFEGRKPFPIRVDEAWYLEQNPDVAEGIRRGEIASAQAHFNQDGYREGRLPFPA